jgi:ATP-dependent DNA helicase UvrD/PcrA
VANRLLRAYGETIGLDPDFTVMDRSDAEDLMDASRHDKALVSKEKRFPRKQTCLSIYSRCVNSSDRLDHTLAAFFPWCIEWEQELRLLFKSYTEAKQARHVLDYDDLLLYWFHLEDGLGGSVDGLSFRAAERLGTPGATRLRTQS